MYIVSELGVSAQFESKIHARKIGNIHKDFGLYKIFMKNFLCKNVPIFQLYDLQDELTHFGLRVSKNFGLEVLVQFGLRISYINNQ